MVLAESSILVFHAVIAATMLAQAAITIQLLNTANSEKAAGSGLPLSAQIIRAAYGACILTTGAWTTATPSAVTSMSGVSGRG